MSDLPHRDPAGADATTRKDRSDLRRGVAINSIGYALKLAHPVLLIVVVRSYGEAAFGVFSAIQAMILVGARVCLLGLDKGALWWVARGTGGSRPTGMLGLLGIVTVSSSVGALLIGTVGSPFIEAWAGAPRATAGLWWMAASLVPLSITEVLLAALLGRRKMEAQVYVREALLSVSLVVLAVALHPLGLGEQGLAIAFFGSYACALGAAVWMYGREFGPTLDRQRVPTELLRYSAPLWLSEILNSAAQRVDVYVVTALSDPATVGIYAAVMQVGNAIRSVRRSFDPIVLAIVSEIGAHDDRARLRVGFSHATALVLATQQPIVFGLFVLAPHLMPLFGQGFEAGVVPVMVLCGFWLLNGLLGLCGLVVAGWGRSDLTLLDVVLQVVSLAALLVGLLPSFGLVGAAVAVGASTTFVNIVQAVQMRSLTGSWNLRPDVGYVLGVGLVATMVGFGLGACLLDEGHGAASIAALLGFVILYVPTLALLHRRGVFAAPQSRRARP